MPTLQEHLDDLDRMVDGGADKPKIRHQIDLIGRIVATNEAERARVAQEYADFKEAAAKKIAALQAENQALVAKYEKLNAPSDNSCMSAEIKGPIDLSTD